MGSLRKYLFNGAIVSAILGGVSALRQQRKTQADWRTYLTWAAWALSLVVAIGSVQIDSAQKDQQLSKKQKKQEKKNGPAKGPKPVKDPR